MKTTAEKIKVMQAYEEGKEIQIWAGNRWSTWYNRVEEPSWNWGISDYRIKPEPKVIYVNEGLLFAHAWRTKQQAITQAPAAATRVAVKYQEVLED